MRLYIDTNVFLDFLWEDRKYHQETSEFFSLLVAHRHITIISTWSLQELYKYVTTEKASMLFGFLKKHMETISHTEEDVREAKRLSPSHFQDALHGILAYKAGADLVVTRDASGFACVRHLVKAVKPEEVFL